ncbi:MAG: hypothetical protein NTV68_08280 [Methanomicrobiales archaeon]|nr:hypothetical protein [Methanomicrobiales archaeon]
MGLPGFVLQSRQHRYQIVNGLPDIFFVGNCLMVFPGCIQFPELADVRDLNYQVPVFSGSEEVLVKKEPVLVTPGRMLPDCRRASGRRCTWHCPHAGPAISKGCTRSAGPRIPLTL